MRTEFGNALPDLRSRHEVSAPLFQTHNLMRYDQRTAET